MNSPLLTEAAKGAESSRTNRLNDTLVRHMNGGLEAHDTEGVVAYTFLDSGGNSLSPYSLLVGGVQSTPVKIYVPLAQNPQPVSTAVNLFEFEFSGIRFFNLDDFSDAVTVVSTEVSGSSLSVDEKQAINGFLGTLAYGTLVDQPTVTINGVSYTFSVDISVETGHILVTYQA